MASCSYARCGPKPGPGFDTFPFVMNDLPALFEGVLAELQQAAQHDKPATPPSADAAAAAAPACGPARCRRGGGAYAPSADVYETQDALVFTLSTPGWQPADINIEFDKGTLTISTAAPPSAGAAPQDAATLLRERPSPASGFRRAFRIRADVAADRIAASLELGVLTVHVPKVAKPAPTKIAVQASAGPAAGGALPAGAVGEEGGGAAPAPEQGGAAARAEDFVDVAADEGSPGEQE